METEVTETLFELSFHSRTVSKQFYIVKFNVMGPSDDSLRHIFSYSVARVQIIRSAAFPVPWDVKLSVWCAGVSSMERGRIY